MSAVCCTPLDSLGLCCGPPETSLSKGKIFARTELPIPIASSVRELELLFERGLHSLFQNDWPFYGRRFILWSDLVHTSTASLIPSISYLSMSTIPGQDSVFMEKRNPPEAIHAWLIMMKASQAVARYALPPILAEGLGDSDFRVLDVLLRKRPMPVNAISAPRWTSIPDLSAG